MRNYIWVAIGGALGTTGRYWLSGVVARPIGETFPWGTLVINVTGSFVIGFFAALTGPDGRFSSARPRRQFVMIGICGGYTTFSSFSLQTLNLMNDGEWFRAGANIRLSVAFCLIAVWAGFLLASYGQLDEVDLTMQIPRDAVLLRIFFGEDDKFHHLPLHEAIVLKAREMHLGGATVLRGHVGFGHSSHIHTTKILRLSQDLPVVVEIVDRRKRSMRFCQCWMG